MTTNSKIPVTVLVAIKNEELNLSKCLDSLKSFQKIYVIDSGSTDNSCQVAAKNGAEVVQFKFKGGYPKKRQWALDNLCIETPWVLMIDAVSSS